MSVETISRQPPRDEKLRIQILGGGANTQHFGGALRKAREARYPVDLFEMQPVPPALVPRDRFFLMNTPEGKREADAALKQPAHVVYVSLAPHQHVEVIEEQSERVGDGTLDFIVAPKPVVRNIPEMKRVDTAIAAAMEQKKQRAEQNGEEFDPTNIPLYVHEHYIVKGAWSALRDQLGTVMDRLGRLESATITIQEARTVEAEGRQAAFAGGALEDLGPHAISLGLDVVEAFGLSERFKTPTTSKLSLQRFRYDDSTLEEHVDTGFIIHGTTTISSKNGDEPYDLPFTWQGGKGLVDDKRATLCFENGRTIVVDFQKNTLDVPEEVADLFPDTQFTDNGYGDVVEAGLGGGDPAESFQTWETARKVVKIGAHIVKQSVTPPIIYRREGQSLTSLNASS